MHSLFCQFHERRLLSFSLALNFNLDPPRNTLRTSSDLTQPLVRRRQSSSPRPNKGRPIYGGFRAKRAGAADTREVNLGAQAK